MRRKTILTAVLLVLLPLCLFADEYISFWNWSAEDPDVIAYRYQLNGEDPDGWTVVSADVTEYVYSIEDPTKDNILYLQSSYDGENWSESAISVTPAPEPVRPEVAVSVVEEAPAVAEIIAEEPVAASATEVKASVNKSGRWFVTDRLGFNVSVLSWASDSGTTLSPKARFAIIDKISAGYQFNDWFRLGLTTGFAYQFTSYENTKGYMYIPLTIDTDFRFAKVGSVDFWAQLSLGGYDRIVGNRYQLGPMGAFSLYAEYAVNDHFMVGAGTGVSVFFTIFKNTSGLGSEILFEANPVYLTCTYMF